MFSHWQVRWNVSVLIRWRIKVSLVRFAEQGKGKSHEDLILTVMQQKPLDFFVAGVFKAEGENIPASVLIQDFHLQIISSTFDF